jgi:hypothetical protein
MRRAMACLREKAPSNEPGEADANSGASPLVLGDSWATRSCDRGALQLLQASSTHPHRLHRHRLTWSVNQLAKVFKVLCLPQGIR